MSYRLHKEGNPYIIIAILFFIATLIWAALFTSPLSIIIFLTAAVFLILFLIFFRNPPRTHQNANPDILLAPADGKVVVIEKTSETEYLNSAAIQISIFMSPLNVHSNRSPVEGDVVYQKYHSGNYLVAWHPKSSELNERNTVVIQHNQTNILIRQIAGKVARKIVSYTKVGEHLLRGQEFGFIKFGSRVDVFLPVDTTIHVKIGDIVQGGVTELATLNSN